MKRSRSCSAASRVMIAPPTTSAWPFKYFVVECTTRSAPSSSGRCSTVVAGDHVIAGAQQLHDRRGRGAAGPERDPVLAGLERGQTPFERAARRVVRPRILEALVLTRPILGKRGRQVERQRDRAGARV